LPSVITFGVGDDHDGEATYVGPLDVPSVMLKTSVARQRS
jgi:hypothetical protein